MLAPSQITFNPQTLVCIAGAVHPYSHLSYGEGKDQETVQSGQCVCARRRNVRRQQWNAFLSRCQARTHYLPKSVVTGHPDLIPRFQMKNSLAGSQQPETQGSQSHNHLLPGGTPGALGSCGPAGAPGHREEPRSWAVRRGRGGGRHKELFIQICLEFREFA